MGLLKNAQQFSINVANTNKAILEHITTGKKYLVQEVIPTGGAAQIEDLINIFYEHGYMLKTVSNIGLNTKTMGREPITLVFEKI